MHVPFGTSNVFLVPFDLHWANVHCDSWGQRVRDLLQNARTLWHKQRFARTLLLELGKSPLCQLGQLGLKGT